ncbi:MAG: hypothetical protein WDZ37_01250 [Solirubrobacterales bacterium]
MDYPEVAKKAKPYLQPGEVVRFATFGFARRLDVWLAFMTLGLVSRVFVFVATDQNIYVFCGVGGWSIPPSPRLTELDAKYPVGSVPVEFKRSILFTTVAVAVIVAAFALAGVLDSASMVAVLIFVVLYLIYFSPATLRVGNHMIGVFQYLYPFRVDAKAIGQLGGRVAE